MQKPLVAIVGRPNVGKSTLFNRIVGERRAVVSDIPGTTRDRIVADAEWNGRTFLVVDTGGIEVLPSTVETGRAPLTIEPLLRDSEDFIPLIRAQAEAAIGDADLVLFLTDAIAGITSADREVADLLRRSKKPVILVANKAESQVREQNALEFYELGIGEVLTVSAIHGSGVGDLLDLIVEALPWIEEPDLIEDDAIHVAIIGRPNVGKSSLLNRLLGQERAIVSPVAGTTRDAVDTAMEYDGQRFVLVDTAGIRRRGKVESGVEKWSVLRTARALQRTDLALVLIDGTEGITAQDTHIAGMTLDEGVSVVVLVNKWDAVEPELRQHRADLEEHVREELKFLNYVPVLFISALTGSGVQQVLPTAQQIVEARYQHVPSGPLSDLVQQAVIEHAPPSKSGRRLRIFSVAQVGVAPPHFVFSVDEPKLVHFSYERYLENRIRAQYPFPGTPIQMTFRGNKPEREPRR
ncbi:MAG: ribosome biogenesis GTPase Der [Anaerolineae bacterium]|nr:ribosome biogenesis GTPase Der [Anaerolineae bacterium]